MAITSRRCAFVNAANAFIAAGLMVIARTGPRDLLWNARADAMSLVATMSGDELIMGMQLVNALPVFISTNV
jgi:hypothetical protein